MADLCVLCRERKLCGPVCLSTEDNVQQCDVAADISCDGPAISPHNGERGRSGGGRRGPVQRGGEPGAAGVTVFIVQ